MVLSQQSQNLKNNGVWLFSLYFHVRTNKHSYVASRVVGLDINMSCCHSIVAEGHISFDHGPERFREGFSHPKPLCVCLISVSTPQ